MQSSSVKIHSRKKKNLTFFHRVVSREDPGIEFLALRVGKRTHVQTEFSRHRKTKLREPVSSTSRHGARAAYHDEYPRDFGPRIGYTPNTPFEERVTNP